MALRVGQLVAFLRLDKGDYDKGLSQAKTEAKKAADDISKNLEKVGAGLGVATASVVALGGALAATGLSFNDLQQRSRAALTAIMGGAEQANAQMDRLFEFTKTSPLPKEEYIAAQQTLISFGVEANKVVGYLQAIDDTAAAFGGDSQLIGRITTIMGQIQSESQLTGVHLMQLGRMGIDAAAIIGDRFGVTASQIREYVSQGAIDAETALDALAAGLEDRFGGAAENVKQQFSGAKDAMAAAWRDLGSALVEPFVSAQGGGAAVGWINDLAGLIRAAIPLVGALSARFTELSGESTVFRDLASWISGIDTGRIADLVDHLSAAVPAIAGISAGLMTLAGSRLPILSGLIGSLNPLVAALTVGLGVLAVSSPQLRSALVDLVAAASPLLEALAQIATVLAGLVSSVAGAAGSLLTSLVPAVSAVVGIISPLVSALAVIVDLFNMIPGPIQTVVLTFAALVAFRGPLLAMLTGFVGMIRAAGAAVVGFVVHVKTLIASLGGIGGATKAAGSALLGAFGGSAGLGITAAITAATWAMGKWQQIQQETAAAEAAHRAQLAALADTLDRISGAATTASASSITKDWVEDGTIDTLREIGISTTAAVEAATAGGEAFERFGTQVFDYMKAAAESADATDSMKDSWGILTDKAEEAGISVREMFDSHLATEGSLLRTAFPELVDAYRNVRDAQRTVTLEGAEQRQIFDELATQIADTAGVVADDLIAALHDAAEDGDLLEEVLARFGITGDQAATAINLLKEYTVDAGDGMHVLAGSAEAAAGALAGMGADAGGATGNIFALRDALIATVQAAAAVRSGIASTLTGFVDPLGAWNDAAAAANRAGGGGGGGSRRNAALDAANEAVEAGRRKAESTKKSAKSERDAAVKAATEIRDAILKQAKTDTDAAKSAEKNAKDRATAARQEADELKRIADEKRKIADDAETRLQDAEFRKKAADAARRAAQAGLDLSDDPATQAMWQGYLSQTIDEQSDAVNNLSDARVEAARTARESADADAAATKSAASSADAAKAASDAVAEAARIVEEAGKQKEKADDAYAKAKEKADLRYQKSVDAVTDTLDKLIEQQSAARKSAEDMGSGVGGAVTAMGEEIQPTFEQYLQTLRDQVEAQENWASNMIELAGKLPPEVASELSQLGPKAAPMVQALVDSTQDEFDEWVALWPKSTEDGVKDLTDAIVAAIPGVAEAGGKLGKAQVDAMMEELRNANPKDFAEIMRKYGLDMQVVADKNPVVLKTEIDDKAKNQLKELMRGTYKVPVMPDGRTMGRFASGGGVFGPGTGTSDSILAMLSNGEHVWDAAAVSGFPGGHIGLEALRAASRAGALRPGMLPGFAAGGPVVTTIDTSVQPGQTPGTGDGGPRFQITNYYPQAEPTSVTVNKALATMSVMGSMS